MKCPNCGYAAQPAQGKNPPFENCAYRQCDLPGQCVAEGKCHHPKQPAQGATESALKLDAKLNAAFEAALSRSPDIELAAAPASDAERQEAGMVLVPIEPTEQMYHAWKGDTSNNKSYTWAQSYRAMIKAALAQAGEQDAPGRDK